MKKVLIIEDERDLAELLAFNLEKEGYGATCVHDGKVGLEQAVRDLPDLILLDLMLPGILGTEICRSLRKDQRTARIPIIMITAKGDEIDRVVGFEVGADDYIVKPFSMREVLLRVKAVMRRQENEIQPAPSSGILILGEISIDTQRHTVVSAGLEIELTSTEFKLLLYLAENAVMCKAGKNCWRRSGVTIIWEIPEPLIPMLPVCGASSGHRAISSKPCAVSATR